MSYSRPKSSVVLTKDEKIALLQKYNDFYESNKDLLNIKVPREAFSSVLDKIGSIVLEESAVLAKQEGPAKRFLDEAALPDSFVGLLPDDFRVFCLILNSLKQWVAAEQSATDRYLFGGTARDTFRSITTHCLVTGKLLDKSAKLHHPVRDGRPPILLSEEGHARIEGQMSNKKSESNYIDYHVENDAYSVLLRLKHAENRSWVQLRNGCMDYLGESVAFSTKPIRNISRAFARKACKETGLSFKQVIDLLNEKGFGR